MAGNFVQLAGVMAEYAKFVEPAIQIGSVRKLLKRHNRDYAFLSECRDLILKLLILSGLGLAFQHQILFAENLRYFAA